MTVSINHDPFARMELVRITVDSEKPCAFCGRRRDSGRLFNYGVQKDGIRTRPHWDKHLFCSVICYRHFHS